MGIFFLIGLILSGTFFVIVAKSALIAFEGRVADRDVEYKHRITSRYEFVIFYKKGHGLSFVGIAIS